MVHAERKRGAWLISFPRLGTMAHASKSTTTSAYRCYVQKALHLNVSETVIGTSPRKFLEMMIFPLRSMMNSAEATIFPACHRRQLSRTNRSRTLTAVSYHLWCALLCSALLWLVPSLPAPIPGARKMDHRTRAPHT